MDSLIRENAGLPVADSSTSSPNNFIKREQIKGFLLSSCLSAPGVLGAIQGNSADMDGEPWLYHLFCNGLNLAYPSSGAALFNTLANYTYALQFQLHFLYLMCRGNATVCCWSDCRFGESIQPQNSGSPVTSHICPTECTKNGGSHNHSTNPDQCEHHGCGSSLTNQSPLQAFLTDNLRGFTHSLPSSTDHLGNHPPGAMCHVKMGFTANDLRGDPSRSDRIYYTLYFFCGSQHDPLRRLGETLTCLTRRTPRTLGDVFGFVWHLNSQLFGTTQPKVDELIEKLGRTFGLGDNISDNFTKNPYSVVTILWNKIAERKSNSMSPSPPTATGISLSLETMAPSIPFLYQLFMAKDVDSLPVVLFDLYQQCHKVETNVGGRMTVTHNVDGVSHHNHNCSTSPADLFSLQISQCTGPNCGPYLSPLTHALVSAFAAKHASSYLSWVLYLTDDVREWLNELKRQFQQLECSQCSSTCQSGGNCHVGTNVTCQCDSVVRCSGVLPLLYANGFTFGNAYSLKGGMQGRDSTKRSCQQFYKQLTAVLAQNENTPLYK
ncbi:variant erythrocyte surface antigen-1, alpha subunit [Babesia caballi]|uniref:Variant erythrocyte surface antigen-1, alpha subunit n=1 Tax=Babesia caballi TaxID=5871 RepID=A0AAV4LQ41_BABCB|nr:variant erythrocyte surface antigen-1, alpha subunit [Babesia caballi]